MQAAIKQLRPYQVRLITDVGNPAAVSKHVGMRDFRGGLNLIHLPRTAARWPFGISLHLPHEFQRTFSEFFLAWIINDFQCSN